MVGKRPGVLIERLNKGEHFAKIGRGGKKTKKKGV